MARSAWHGDPADACRLKAASPRPRRGQSRQAPRRRTAAHARRCPDRPACRASKSIAVPIAPNVRRVWARRIRLVARRRRLQFSASLSCALRNSTVRLIRSGRSGWPRARVLDATRIGDDRHGQWSVSFFVRVNVIDERLNVVAMGQARLLLAHFQARACVASSSAAAVEDEVVEGLLFRIGLLDVLGHPIGHLAVGDGSS